MTSYFTFGQSHFHNIEGVIFDRNVVVKINATDPRAEMFKICGPKWSMQYDEPPNMEHFPRGIIELTYP